MTIDVEGAAQATHTDDDDEADDENYRIDPLDAGDDEDVAVLQPYQRLSVSQQ
jgi:hypothetical protein